MTKAFLFSFLVLNIFITNAQERFYPYSDGQKWGLTNANLDPIIAPQFDSAFNFLKEDYSIVKNGLKYGVINKKGQITVPVVYESIKGDFGSIGTVYLNRKPIIMDLLSGMQISSTIYDEMTSCNCREKFYFVRSGAKKGILNARDGKIINKLIYDEAKIFYSYHLTYDWNLGTIAEIILQRKHGLLDPITGNFVLKPIYTQIGTVRKNGTTYLVGISGKIKKYFTGLGKEVPVEKTKAMSFESSESISISASAPSVDMSDVVVVSDRPFVGKDIFVYDLGNRKWRLAEENRMKDQTEIISEYFFDEYDKIEKMKYDPFRKKIFLKATKNGKVGMINETGIALLAFLYDDIKAEFEYFSVIINGLHGLSDTYEKIILKPIFSKISKYRDYKLNAWYVELPDGKKGYADGRKIYIPGVSY